MVGRTARGVTPIDPVPPPRSATDTHDFAPIVRILGRGPGRSRSLTRAEARFALGEILAGRVEREQVGALLMLLRYRGEAVEEMVGLIEAARDHSDLPWRFARTVDLDWPSYADGRTRGLPWYVLAALLLAKSGRLVLMHGPISGPGRQPLIEAMTVLGIKPARSPHEAEAALDTTGFAFMPLEVVSPAMANLLALRGVLGLRSPMNTVGRLLDPAGAAGSIDGVFHPAYIALHLGAAAMLGRRVAVLKGGGGEAEWTGVKSLLVTTRDGEQLWPAIDGAGKPESARAADLVDVWHGRRRDPAGEAAVIATAAVALRAAGRCEDPLTLLAEARQLWQQRHERHFRDR